MPLGEIGAFLLVLVAVFIWGRFWFHLVEAVLRRLKRLLPLRADPPAWHPLRRENEDREDGSD